jgi:hypothetical protein
VEFAEGASLPLVASFFVAKTGWAFASGVATFDELLGADGAAGLAVRRGAAVTAFPSTRDGFADFAPVGFSALATDEAAVTFDGFRSGARLATFAVVLLALVLDFDGEAAFELTADTPLVLAGRVPAAFTRVEFSGVFLIFDRDVEF